MDPSVGSSLFFASFTTKSHAKNNQERKPKPAASRHFRAGLNSDLDFSNT